MSSCAFSGHRPQKFPWKYNESDPRCAALKAMMLEEITKMVQTGVTGFYTGGAEGIDCWAAEIVLSLREKNPALKLHCVLPHKGQADKWNHSAQERYYSILKQADSVEYVSQDYYDGCMIDRNHRLVESADFLLAVYNGTRRSGTGATVNNARKLGRKIIVINPITRQIVREGFTKLPERS